MHELFFQRVYAIASKKEASRSPRIRVQTKKRIIVVGGYGASGLPRGSATEEAARAPFKQHKEAQISGALLSPNEHFIGLLRSQF